MLILAMIHAVRTKPQWHHFPMRLVPTGLVLEPCGKGQIAAWTCLELKHSAELEGLRSRGRAMLRSASVGRSH